MQKSSFLSSQADLDLSLYVYTYVDVGKNLGNTACFDNIIIQYCQNFLNTTTWNLTFFLQKLLDQLIQMIYLAEWRMPVI